MVLEYWSCAGLVLVMSVTWLIPLQEPHCKMCTSTPIVKTSKHLFLDLSKVISKHVIKDIVFLPVEQMSRNIRNGGERAACIHVIDKVYPQFIISGNIYISMTVLFT